MTKVTVKIKKPSKYKVKKVNVTNAIKKPVKKTKKIKIKIWGPKMLTKKKAKTTNS